MSRQIMTAKMRQVEIVDSETVGVESSPPNERLWPSGEVGKDSPAFPKRFHSGVEQMSGAVVVAGRWAIDWHEGERD